MKDFENYCTENKNRWFKNNKENRFIDSQFNSQQILMWFS